MAQEKAALLVVAILVAVTSLMAVAGNPDKDRPTPTFHSDIRGCPDPNDADIGVITFGGDPNAGDPNAGWPTAKEAANQILAEARRVGRRDGRPVSDLVEVPGSQGVFDATAGLEPVIRVWTTQIANGNWVTGSVTICGFRGGMFAQRPQGKISPWH